MKRTGFFILLLLLLTGCTAQPTAVEQPLPDVANAAAEMLPFDEEAPAPTVQTLAHTEAVTEDAVANSDTFDLSFFFSIPGETTNTYSIAPEGSEEWVTLGEDVFAGSCSYAKEHNVAYSLAKYQINFESETTGFWKIRVCAGSSANAEVLQEWHNIPIMDAHTLLYAWTVDLWLYPGLDGEQSVPVIAVDQITFCDSCPDEWRNGGDSET